MTKRILLVGGHLAPALAVIEEIRAKKPWQIFWAGRKTAIEGKSFPSLEYEVIPKLGIPFFELRTGRLQRRWTSHTIPSLLRLLPGIFSAFSIILRVRPKVLFSFGGYLAPPLVIAAKLLGVKVIIHEQTTTSGLANRFSAQFADKVAISYPTSFVDFPKNKTVLVGNPVRRDILKIKRLPTNLIYITGGGQGSQTINRAIEPILSELIAKFSIIHQTGFADYKKFAKLTKKFPGKYQVFPTLPPSRVNKIYQKAALVISRSGSNTVSEIAATGIPAIFIPIPWSERDEQGKNAKLLVETGLARILPQGELTPKKLLALIEDFISNLPPKSSILRSRQLIHPDAARKIVSEIEKLLI